MDNKNNAWLSKQIDAAKKNVDTWPNWMQKAARFEGGDISTKSTRVTGGVCHIDKRQAAK